MTARGRTTAPIATALSAFMILAGCTGSAPTPSNGSGAPARSTPTPAATPATAPPGSGASTSFGAPVLGQAWATAPLVDVAAGDTFRIADHAGKVIIIESMAIWCTNCRIQQADVKAALGRLPTDSVVYVVLDVDPNEDGPSLAAYQAQNGFDGRYAIAGRDVARALAADFGDQFLNPPATPILVIGTDGRVTLTEYGHKSTDEIVALAEAHGA